MGNESGFFEKTFKLRFGLKLCLLTIAGMLAVTIFLYFATSKSLGDSYGQAIYAIYDLKIRIFPLVFASFYTIFILAVVTCAIALISVLFSHKIAGPLYRIERNLEQIGSGDLTVDTAFRGNDQLTALAGEINGMVRSLNHLARSCGDAVADIKMCEDRLSSLLKEGEPPEKDIREAMEGLRRALEELKRAAGPIELKE